ncbi:MAG: hypothetical protein JXX28_18355 [Deltaproteobacteria bacterium]|nr:hypothetical protein [Deltaproteobacteria bacterium]
MQTKTCPSCEAEVPVAASRCKECFHDFNEEPPRKSGPIALLAAFAAMAVLSAGAVWWVLSQPIETHILVNEESHAVEFVRQYRDHVETESLPWAEVTRLQHLTTSTGDFELAVYMTDGRRVVIEANKKAPLVMKARHYAAMMDRPLEEISKAKGFGGQPVGATP